MSSETIRDKTKNLLEKYISSKGCMISKECIKLEKLIHKNAVNQSKKNCQSVAFYYKGISYSVLGMFEKKMSYLDVLKILEGNKVFFQSPSFESFAQDKVNKQRLLIEPPKIEKGAVKCSRCGSDSVFFFTDQNRSADEAMTVHFSCFGRKKDGTLCGKKWKE